MATFDYCNQEFDIQTGIYDDGDFMCGNCVARYTKNAEAKQLEREDGTGDEKSPDDDL